MTAIVIVDKRVSLFVHGSNEEKAGLKTSLLKATNVWLWCG
jgi:hypothetical protein